MIKAEYSAVIIILRKIQSTYLEIGVTVSHQLETDPMLHINNLSPRNKNKRPVGSYVYSLSQTHSKVRINV